MNTNVIPFRQKAAAHANSDTRSAPTFTAPRAGFIATAMAKPIRRVLTAQWHRNAATGRIECRWLVQPEQDCGSVEEPPPSCSIRIDPCIAA